MDTENELFALKGKTVSKLLVILFAALLCSAFVITLADDSAAAPVRFTDDGIKYIVESEGIGDVPGTVTIDENSGIIGDLEIPSTVTYNSKIYSVSSIGESAFYECSDLTSVVLPDSLKSIGKWAFEDCSGLTSVIIGSNVELIGLYAFSNCVSLKSIIIPDSVIAIKKGAFEYCNALESVTIGNSVTDIGSYSFFQCYCLTSVIIPDSVINIYEGAFSDCTSLTSVTIGNGVTSIEEELFGDCTNLTSVTIGNSVTSIGDSAFSGCSKLISIIIPESVTSIYGNAFLDCSGLTSVTIVSGVTDIDDNAFSGCKFLLLDGITEVLKTDLAGYTYSGADRTHLVRGVNAFNVTFMSGEETILSYKIGSGASIVLPDVDVVKESTSEYDYTFSNWEGYIVGAIATEDVTFTAVFNEIDNSSTDVDASNNTMLYVGIAVVLVVIISLVSVFVIRSKNKA